MRDLKYITVLLSGFKRAIIFNGLFTHKDIADSLPEGAKVLGAGFCGFSKSEVDSPLVGFIHVKCFGNSSSLKIGPSEEDESIISGTVNRNDLF